MNQEINPSITLARKSLPKIYKWLYHHDRQWLIDINIKYAKRSKNTQLRINWNQLDDKLLVQVKQNKIDLLRSHKRKITKAKLIRSLSIQKMITKDNEWKLPKTMDFIDKNVESKDAFHDRKIRIVLDKLLSNNERVSISTVLAACGLRKLSQSSFNKLSKILKP